MKNRLKAVLLATGLTAGLLCLNAYAGEAETEGVVEALTEAAEEESAVLPSEEDRQANLEELYKSGTAELLARYSAMTDAEIADAIENGDTIAGNWDSMREEVGSFVEVVEQTVDVDENIYTVESVINYDKVPDNATATVTTVFNAKKSGSEALQSIEWNVDYPMGKLIAEAGLNTLMGLGVVFLALLFLSFVISRLGLLGNVGKKKAAPAPAPAPAPVAATQAPAEEEELADDSELVAVIAAAIAAYEGTGTDGFTVRSIRKARRR